MFIVFCQVRNWQGHWFLSRSRSVETLSCTTKVCGEKSLGTANLGNINKLEMKDRPEDAYLSKLTRIQVLMCWD